ncbi:MAG: hypothetical protein ABIP94_21500 [Planctomycetota bacterium]
MATALHVEVSREAKHPIADGETFEWDVDVGAESAARQKEAKR